MPNNFHAHAGHHVVTFTLSLQPARNGRNQFALDISGLDDLSEASPLFIAASLSAAQFAKSEASRFDEYERIATEHQWRGRAELTIEECPESYMGFTTSVFEVSQSTTSSASYSILKRIERLTYLDTSVAASNTARWQEYSDQFLSRLPIDRPPMTRSKCVSGQSELDKWFTTRRKDRDSLF